MEEPEPWLQTPVKCPRCENRWRSLETFYGDTVDKESVYESDRIQYIPDPPLDSLVALMSGSLKLTVEELRETYNDEEGTEIHLHCGLCAIEMAWKNEVPGFNPAVMAGVKRGDEEDVV